MDNLANLYKRIVKDEIHFCYGNNVEKLIQVFFVILFFCLIIVVTFPYELKKQKTIEEINTNGVAISQMATKGTYKMHSLEDEIAKNRQEKIKIEQREAEVKQIQVLINRKQIVQKLKKATSILNEISVTYTEENVQYRDEVETLLETVKSQIKVYPEELSPFLNMYYHKKVELYHYDAMMESIFKKMDNMQVSTHMDLSKTLGFTEEELTYLLLNLKRPDGKVITDDKDLAICIAEGIVSTTKDNPVNELFVLSVMSYESYYFENEGARKANNFSGMMDGGRLLQCENVINGAQKSVECIYNNMKRGNTACDINESYCKPLNDYQWAKKVISIMSTYQSTEIGKSEFYGKEERLAKIASRSSF